MQRPFRRSLKNAAYRKDCGRVTTRSQFKGLARFSLPDDLQNTRSDILFPSVASKSRERLPDLAGRDSICRWRGRTRKAQPTPLNPERRDRARCRRPEPCVPFRSVRIPMLRACVDAKPDVAIRAAESPRRVFRERIRFPRTFEPSVGAARIRIHPFLALESWCLFDRV
jgi:hypothetical protein